MITRSFSRSHRRHLSALAVGGALFAASGLGGLTSVALADEIGPLEEACQRKQENAACALANGGEGICVSKTDERGRTRLTCEPGKAAPSAKASASPPASASPSNGPPAKSGCSVSLGPESGAVAPLLACLGVFAIGLRRARRDRR